MHQLLAEQINAGVAKILLLSQGVNISDSVLESIQENAEIEENHYYYNISNDYELCKSYKLPSEILLPDDVESSFYINPDSSLKIELVGEAYYLYLQNKPLFPIEFNYKPLFFEKELSDGSKGKKYASMYGRYILGLFLNGSCDYVNKGLSCKFCSIGPARKGPGAQNALAITRDRLSELMYLLSPEDKERIKYIMYTAGTYPDVNKGIEIQANLISIVNGILPRETYGHHLTTMPPTNAANLYLLKDAGLDSIAYDIEVYNEHLFKYFCPGKDQKFGRSAMFRAIDEALGVFGHSNVKVGFVGGIEPLPSLIEGMRYFGSRGASIAVNVFHPDPYTPLALSARPTPEYLLEMVKAQSEVYKSYDLVPVFPEGGRRSSLDGEVYRGFFDNISL